jgi:hypothetical protein
MDSTGKHSDGEGGEQVELPNEQDELLSELLKAASVAGKLDYLPAFTS